MATRFHPLGRVLLVGASLGLIVAGGATVLRLTGTPSAAQGTQDIVASPIEALPSVIDPLPATSAAPRATAHAAADRGGVPVAIDIPVASSHHPHGMQASISAHPLNADQTLFVPPNPADVAWASQDAEPGANHGTAILVSHVNFVIDGRTVPGAFADLAEYGRTAVGKQLSLRLADGRTLRYRIVTARAYAKDELATRPLLRVELYDQSRSYGPADHPSGRLLLVSCGGPFDPVSGNYEDNVFLYALPVS